MLNLIEIKRKILNISNKVQKCSLEDNTLSLDLLRFQIEQIEQQLNNELVRLNQELPSEE